MPARPNDGPISQPHGLLRSASVRALGRMALHFGTPLNSCKKNCHGHSLGAFGLVPVRVGDHRIRKNAEESIENSGSEIKTAKKRGARRW